MYQFTCKKCRRVGYKVCDSTKCALVRKPYPPGQHGKTARRRLSEFGRQLVEKQKLRLLYGLRERQFKRYFNLVAKKSGFTPQALVVVLEQRLDNVIFRLGFAASRPAARQLVSHGHFLVNGRKINLPSYNVKLGDIVSLREKSKTKKIFGDLRTALKKFQPPEWLELDKEKLEAKVKSRPSPEMFLELPVQLARVAEYYSR